MSFPFYPNIPQPGDNPSVSQGELLQNFQSMGSATSWTTIDHYGFGTGTDGQHKQITLPALSGPIVSPSGTQSSIYSQAGGADNLTAELFLRNRVSTLLLSCVKAFGQVDGSSGSVTNGFNASSVRIGEGSYNVTITGNPTSGSSFCILTGCGRASSGSSTDQVTMVYTITSSTTINFQAVNVANAVPINVVSFSFAILQF
jgi:hypothetical protein